MATELTPTRIAAARRSPSPRRDHRVRRAGLDDRRWPDELDLRRPWHDVPDQGRTSSCVGWAVADSVLRWHLVEGGRLAPDERLSPRYVWMAAKETDRRTTYPSTFLEDDGTSLKTGLDVVRKFGAALERELPWEGALATAPTEQFNASAATRRIAHYYNLGDDRAADRSRYFDDWRRWMHQRGPVLVLLQIDRHLGEPGPLLRDFDPVEPPASHSAALFGYDRESFLLRSTWGPTWGDGGYARMDLDYAARAVLESYGIVV